MSNHAIPISVYWCIIAVVLGLLTFGILNLLYGILYIICFFGGIIAVLYEHSHKEVRKQREYLSTSLSPDVGPSVDVGLDKVLEINYEQNELNSDKRLTGSYILDEKIHECLDNLMRDYVKYWYNDLSDNQEFLHYFRVALHDCIRSISMRCKVIDWQPFLTSTLVDVFASHVKLFRKAQKKFVKFQNGDLVQEEQRPFSSSQQNDNCTDDETKLLDFYFEYEILNENLCRDLISCDLKKQTEYLQSTSEVLLYILLPKHDFCCRPLKYLLRETMVHGIFLPMFQLYSNPDYLNLYINWLISDNCISSDWFLTVLRHSTEMGELHSVCNKAQEEIAKLIAKDSVGDDPVVKQELSSMRYVINLCQRQLSKQHAGNAMNADLSDIENFDGGRKTLYHLPLSVVLRNNIALQIFIEYMQSVNGEAYLYFWLTVDGYRASAEQQLNEVKLQQIKGSINSTPDMEMLRTIGRNIYEQYLSEHSNPRVVLDSSLDKQLQKSLNSGEPSPYIFDEIQQKVFAVMQKNERFFPEFKKSQFYVRLLAELDLLREPSLNSADTNGSSLSGASLQDEQSFSENEETSRLTALITQTGICTEHGKTYALYALTITRYWGNGKQESWSTFRRYREFHDLHLSLKENGSNLGSLRLPGKTFFKDLKEEFLEKRRNELNQYLIDVLDIDHPPKAMECLHTFLDAKAYQKNSRSFARKVDTMMRTSVRNVTNFVAQAPDNFMDGIQRTSDKVFDGLQKFSDKLPSGTSDRKDSGERFTEQIEYQYNIDHNIPLGILLLLMEEVFDLKQKNQWLRRQMVAAVQQVMRTLFGERMNRKIIDYVDRAVSAEQVAVYMEHFRDSFWPGGILAEKTPSRDDATVKRTRVLTKTKMHGAIPDELRPIIGSETCRQGVMCLFELAQHEELNKRFCCVLLESVLIKLFSNNKFLELFNTFHSSSPKLRAHKRDMMSRNSEKSKSLHRTSKPTHNGHL